MKEKVYSYEDILFEDEALQLGEILFNFSLDKINWTELKNKVAKYGFYIDPVLTDYEELGYPEEVKAFEERLANDELNYADIECFMLTTGNHKMFMNCDLKMIKKLAQAGNKEALDMLNATKGIVAELVKNF